MSLGRQGVSHLHCLVETTVQGDTFQAGTILECFHKETTLLDRIDESLFKLFNGNGGVSEIESRKYRIRDTHLLRVNIGQFGVFCIGGNPFNSRLLDYLHLGAKAQIETGDIAALGVAIVSWRF